MYATPYVHPEGFGSVGYLEDIRDDSITVADPIFGTVIVHPDDCFGVISTETGAMLPAVRPALIASPTSSHLLASAEQLAANRNTGLSDYDVWMSEVRRLKTPDQTGVAPISISAWRELWAIGYTPRQAVSIAEEDRYEAGYRTNEAEVIMLRPRHVKDAEMFPSGYPHAWEIIRRWREGVAADWRTVALGAIFARNSIQRPIEEAERLFRTFGPRIRDALLRDKPPSEAQLLQFKGIKDTRAVRLRKKGKRRGEYAWDDIPSYLDIFEWAPWVASQAQSRDYSRGFRNNIAIEWAPRGLGLAKISFTMMLIGRDAACLDTRIQRHIFGEYEEETGDTSFQFGALEEEEAGGEEEAPVKLTGTPERRQFERRVSARSGAKGARGVTRLALDTYRGLEDKLRGTEFFDEKWPMPFARAQ